MKRRARQPPGANASPWIRAEPCIHCLKQGGLPGLLACPDARTRKGDEPSSGRDEGKERMRNLHAIGPVERVAECHEAQGRECRRKILCAQAEELDVGHASLMPE